MPVHALQFCQCWLIIDFDDWIHLLTKVAICFDFGRMDRTYKSCGTQRVGGDNGLGSEVGCGSVSGLNGADRLRAAVGVAGAAPPPVLGGTGWGRGGTDTPRYQPPPSIYRLREGGGGVEREGEQERERAGHSK